MHKSNQIRAFINSNSRSYWSLSFRGKNNNSTQKLFCRSSLTIEYIIFLSPLPYRKVHKRLLEVLLFKYYSSEMKKREWKAIAKRLHLSAARVMSLALIKRALLIKVQVPPKRYCSLLLIKSFPLLLFKQ